MRSNEIQMTLENCLGLPLVRHFALNSSICTCTRDSLRWGGKPLALPGNVGVRESSGLGKRMEGKEYC